MKIITLCGSTKYKDMFLKINEQLTLDGNIVLMPGVFAHVDDIKITNKQKHNLDKLHKKKIDMSDEIFVINVDNYIGESTKSEIEYAKMHNKVVKYLNNLK